MNLGTLEVVQAAALSFSSTVDVDGARTLGKFSKIEIPTAAGPLVIDGVDSSAVCRFDNQPPPTATASVSGAVTLNGTTVTLDPSGVTVLTPAVLPPGGPTSTTTITLTVPAPVVTPNSATATALMVTLAETLTYTTPAVSLTRNESITLARASCVTPGAPTLDTVAPSSGPPGTPITLSGSNFVPGASTVTIGGQTVPIGDLKFLDSGTMVLNVPFGLPPGPALITVSTPAGTSASQSFGVSAPTVRSGRLTEAESGAPLRNGCVVWVDQSDFNRRGSTNTNGDGSWSFTSNDPGPFYLAFFAQGQNGCGGPITATPVPAWYQAQPLSGTDPGTITPPKGPTALAGGTSDVVTCLSRKTVTRRVPRQTEPFPAG